MKQVKLTTLQETAKLKPAGYLQAMLEISEYDGKWVYFDEHRYSALCLRFADYKPSFYQKTLGFVRQIMRWKKAGFRVAHWAVFLDRTRACKGCPFSVPGFFSTCGRCGCTRAKLFLASARCPEKRWRV